MKLVKFGINCLKLIDGHEVKKLSREEKKKKVYEQKNLRDLSHQLNPQYEPKLEKPGMNSKSINQDPTKGQLAIFTCVNTKYETRKRKSIFF